MQHIEGTRKYKQRANQTFNPSHYYENTSFSNAVNKPKTFCSTSTSNKLKEHECNSTPAMISVAFAYTIVHKNTFWEKYNSFAE